MLAWTLTLIVSEDAQKKYNTIHKKLVLLIQTKKQKCELTDHASLVVISFPEYQLQGCREEKKATKKSIKYVAITYEAAINL